MSKERSLPEPSLLKRQFLQTMLLRNCSERTTHVWDGAIRRFLAWCEQRGVTCVSQITPEIVGSYQRYLFHYRIPKSGKPLQFSTQLSYLAPIRRWLLWLVKQEVLSEDPAAEMVLPKEGKRLPMQVPSPDQVEHLLNQPDVASPTGLRDRAIMETFYSTAMRCSDLVNLDVYDVDIVQGQVALYKGKGDKDRVVPIGERALSWLIKYQSDVRSRLVLDSNESAMFVSKSGRRFNPTNMTGLVKSYLLKAGLTMRGACHLLRHAAATSMLANGADIRSLQLMLGHERLDTTQLYTHVSIERLKEVHAQTHPAKPNELPDRS